MSRREPVDYLEPHQRGSCAKCGGGMPPNVAYREGYCHDGRCPYHLKGDEHLHVVCVDCGYTRTMHTKDAA